MEDAGRDLDPVSYENRPDSIPELIFVVSHDGSTPMSVTAPSWPDTAVINPSVVVDGIAWADRDGRPCRHPLGYRRGNKLCITVDNGYAEYIISDETVDREADEMFGIPAERFPVCHRVYVKG